MEGKCLNPDCAAPINCHEGKDNYFDCANWVAGNLHKKKTEPSRQKERKSNLPWTGAALDIDQLSSVTYRTTPRVIGILGRADAGKTTYLAMLYTLFLRGIKLNKYEFCGSNTINSWDELYQRLSVQQEGVLFPDPTPSQYIRLLHLALRSRDERLKDIFLTDASGEVFSIWSKNRNDPNAENARWVYEHSNAFLLFIDCEDLINRKAQSRTDIIDLAQMMKHDLRNRPVVAVWSKSDKKEKVHPSIREKLQSELEELFENFNSIDISNFSADDPDALVHENNILVLDWTISAMLRREKFDFAIEGNKVTGDSFLNYKK